MTDEDDLCWRMSCQHPRVCHGRSTDGRCDGLTLGWPDDTCYCHDFMEEDDYAV